MNKSPTNAAHTISNLPRIVRHFNAKNLAAQTRSRGCGLHKTMRAIAFHHAPRTVAPLLLGLFFCAGCNPNIDVNGALLPAWMVAMVLGIILAVGARALLIRTGIDRFLVARPLVYVSITITFSCLVWLIVFRY